MLMPGQTYFGQLARGIVVRGSQFVVWTLGRLHIFVLQSCAVEWCGKVHHHSRAASCWYRPRRMQVHMLSEG